MVQNCPECGGQVRIMNAAQEVLFCLDCDWDTLHSLSALCSEWYTKTQLKRYRKWTDTDFAVIQPDYVGGYSSKSKWFYTGYYFHQSTVEKHESRYSYHFSSLKQIPVPVVKRITSLSWTVVIRGDELMKHGWTHNMIDRLLPYREHKWRKKRLFRLCDLTTVSDKFQILER